MKWGKDLATRHLADKLAEAEEHRTALSQSQHDRLKDKGTTEIGYTNRNGQTVLRKTATVGNDHNQMVYVLRCNACEHEYGANGSDIFQRRCPAHDGGAAGLQYSV